MKSFKTLFLHLVVGISFCQAQDTTVLLSPAMFKKNRENISLDDKNGWLFKEGYDTAWAKKDLDIRTWKRFKPTELWEKQADINGRLECWFRIKIKIDTSFEGVPLGFRIGTWAATDLYLDGKLMASFGNTNQDRALYREHRSIGMLPVVPVNLKAGNEYILALHFVDYLSTLPPFKLKTSEDLGNLISVVGPKYYSTELTEVKKNSFYLAIWAAVSIILSLLFWVLVVQNRKEKIIQLFALSSTFEALGMLCIAAGSATGISFVSHRLFQVCSDFFIISFIISMPVVIANIFKRKVFRALKIILLLLITGWVTFIILPDVYRITNIILNCCSVGMIGFCIYYIVSSWKTLKGAQWAIVVGVMLTLFVLLLSIFIDLAKLGENVNMELLISGIALIFPISLWIYVIMRFKENINEVEVNAKQVLKLSEEKKEQALNQQKILQEEVNRQTAEIRTTLDDLKSTQSQLIQSEKMASLGELTAGIAHEIQNPLNFVNNFSEVNTELIEELKGERQKAEGERNIQLEDDLLNDLSNNLEKINHHGKRADAIVKGMLQHSRSSNGVKEPTDINALADEYLRLSYHGLRAKDKSFNAAIKTDFDKSLSADGAGKGKINIIAQDIGRVLLNLINNAFYAVDEKKKNSPLTPSRNNRDVPKGEKNADQNEFEPSVSICTIRIGNNVEIRVADNGNGIPQKIVDKIFQPFFTTKPTGQGTGLGLSLSYDIIKAHGGEIKVETKEGEGSVFIIQLTLQ